MRRDIVVVDNLIQCKLVDGEHNGQRKDPWGTLQFIFAWLDESFPTDTEKVLSLR